jgi:putative ABC transport system ATP-binding protein
LNKEQGVTVISATHDHKMVDVSDRIVVIRDGRVDKIELREDIEVHIGEMSVGEEEV